MNSQAFQSLLLAYAAASMLSTNIWAGQPGSATIWGEYAMPIIQPGTRFIGIAAGVSHNLAITTNGNLVGWGNNFAGTSTPPDGVSNVVAAAAGSYNSVALKADGTVVAWGWNQPLTDMGLSDITRVAASGERAVALQSNGTVFDGAISQW